MTPQNTLTTINDELPIPKDIRTTTIVEQRLSGESWNNIANNLQINRKTLYDIRQKQDFQLYINSIIPLYNQSIKELMDSKKENIRLGATLEYGRMIRAGIPREIHQTTQGIEVKIVMHGELRDREE